MSEDSVIDRYSMEVIGPEHAVYLPDLDHVPDINDYVKAVAAVVGVRKIRSAYRKNGKIKMYLRYRSSVDEIAGTTVSVRGKKTIVNRAWVDATRILLTEVDSEIPNSLIKDALTPYGDKISPILTLGLHTQEPENSQIETNVRQVYMKLSKDSAFPRELEVCYRGINHKLIVKVEDDEYAPELERVNESTVPDIDSVPDIDTAPDATAPLTPKIVIEPLSPSVIACTSTNDPPASAPPCLTPQKKRLAPCSPARPSALQHRFIGHRFMGKGKQPHNSHVYKKFRSSPPESSAINSMPSPDDSVKAENLEVAQQTVPQASDIPNVSNISNEQSTTQSSSSTAGINVNNIRQYPFNLETFEDFLVKVNNRNPLDIALQMLEENNTPGAIEDLCHQIVEYSSCMDASTKVRLNRLLILLSGGKFCLPS